MKKETSKDLEKKIYFITGNPNKFSEVKAILGNVEQMDIDLPEIQEIDAKRVIEAKLLEARKENPGKEFIVEDTSLYLNCLNGLPGPLIKWFIETVGNEGLVKMTEPFENTKASAKTIIGYVNPDGDIFFFAGEIKGNVVAPCGENGFGFDKIFQPEGYEKTFGEMNAFEKNEFSMRKLACEKLKYFLDKR